MCSSEGNGDNDPKNQRKESFPPSLKNKYEILSDTKPDVIFDYHEEMYGVRWDEKHQLKEEDPDEASQEGYYLYREKKAHKKKAYQFSRKRGVTGVFDIEDLVDALRSEQLLDLMVIKVPAKASYCDFLVLATARSVRHLSSVIEFIRKLYKLKKHDSDPQLSYTIGEKLKSNWQVLDFGHIVLHVFLPGVREQYDLETLWSCGPEFDDKTVRPVYDPVTDILEKHVKFMEGLQPLEEQSKKPDTEPLVAH